MTKKLSTILLAMITLATIQLQGQSITFENALNAKLKNYGVIMEDQEIRGYYYFYSYKKSGKERGFIVRIIDQNLKEVNVTEFTDSKHTFLVEGQFNGEAIVLKFVNPKYQKMTFMSFDKRGNQIAKIERDLRDKESGQYWNKGVALQTNYLMDLNNEGFLNYVPLSFDRTEIISYSNKLEKNWTYTSKSSGAYTSVAFLQKSDSKVYNLISKTKGMNARKMSFFIQSLNIADGTEDYNVGISDAQYNNQPLTAYYDDNSGTLNVMGVYYAKNANIARDQGLGLFQYELDESGVIVSKKYLSWLKDFREVTQVNNSGKLVTDGSSGYIYFHDVVKCEDGSIIAIGEQYKKAASAVGIMSNVASAALGGYGGSSSTKMVIGDIVMFHMSPDFKIKAVKYVDKTKSDFFMPAGYGFVNTHLLSQYVKAGGGFDYAYKTINKQDEAISFCYLDFEKSETGSGKEWVFGSMTYVDDDFVSDKIRLGKSSSANKIRILPAKAGYVNVIEYNSREKSVISHLEKINY
jgi:hypothetical protein